MQRCRIVQVSHAVASSLTITQELDSVLQPYGVVGRN